MGEHPVAAGLGGVTGFAGTRKGLSSNPTKDVPKSGTKGAPSTPQSATPTPAGKVSQPFAPESGKKFSKTYGPQGGGPSPQQEQMRKAMFDFMQDPNATPEQKVAAEKFLRSYIAQ
jgi:hypothetical protein